MAAKNGTLTVSHPNTPQKDSISFYLDDTAGNPARFSMAGKAVAARATSAG